MRDTFPCLQQAGTGLFKAKGSKFHGYAFPLPFHDEAAAERAVDEHLEAVRKEHHAARHVCYAWQFGPARFRAADDGEPGGSAEPPSTACSAPTISTGPSLPSCGISECQTGRGRTDRSLSRGWPRSRGQCGLSHNVLKLYDLRLSARLDSPRREAIQQAGADIVGERYSTVASRPRGGGGRWDPLTRTLLNIHGVDLVEPKTLHPLKWPILPPVRPARPDGRPRMPNSSLNTMG